MLPSTAGPVAVGSKLQALPTADQKAKAEQAPKFSQLFNLARQECGNHVWTDENELCTREQIVIKVSSKWPDVHKDRIRKIVREVREQNRKKAVKSTTTKAVISKTQPAATQSTSQPKANESYESWVFQQFLDHGFDERGVWIGVEAFKRSLLAGRSTNQRKRIRDTVSLLMKPGHRFSFNIDGQWQTESNRSNFSKILSNRPTPPSIATPLAQTRGLGSPSLTQGTHSRLEAESQEVYSFPKDDLLARQLNQLHLLNSAAVGRREGGSSGARECSFANTDGIPLWDSGGSALEQLVSNESDSDEDDGLMHKTVSEIQHAPLIAASLITGQGRSLLPQYGLLGSVEKEKLFLNTNVPFSAFICGVQGSGKSHTTACILENVLIPSNQLGCLERPLSALVFSYGEFAGDGSGFNISEAAFLATPHPRFPSHPSVKRVNVFVSPSNYTRISHLYLRVPNVTVIRFKLKPHNLDIDIMLTLMNVSESEGQPLYMAAVTQILREMATQSGPFNYIDFKAKIGKCGFNPTQENMLNLRLGLLESFLDMDNSCPEPQFKEGEVTIMDMSCPFVDANTACILFKIGLQRYLQSKVAGKMVVLDEAHKYMLPNHGAKALNESLLTTIRLQRHYGVRVLISTQEPTLLTDLIALCSVTIIHRFSSPEWFAAIKRHIPMHSNEYHETMEKIERLKTGMALVYAPAAALSIDKQGKLVNGVSQLLKLKVRKRVTNDGGMSVLAV